MNWSRMQNHTATPGMETVAPSQGSAGTATTGGKAMRNKKTFRLWLLMVMVVLAAFAAGWSVRQGGLLSAIETITPKEAAERLTPAQKRALTLKLKAHCDENIQAVDNAKRELQSALDKRTSPHFRTAEDRVPDSVSRLTSMGACGKLVVKMAADKVRGTQTASNAVLAIIEENQGRACLDANREAEMCLAEYRLALVAADNNLRAAVIAEMGNVLPDGPDLGPYAVLQERIADMVPFSKTVALSSVLASTSLAIDAAVWMSLYRTIQAVFGPLAARAATTVTTSTLAAAADGPLPFGEVAALGITGVFTLWSAHDFYKARKVLRPELESKLTSAVGEFRKNVLEGVCKRADALETAAAKNREELVTTLEKDLS